MPGKSHGQRSLEGYSPWGQRVRCDLVTKPKPKNTDVSALPARSRKGAQVKTLSYLKIKMIMDTNKAVVKIK